MKSHLVERFSDWADVSGVKRFWGIGKLGDGRITVLLPTLSPTFRAILVVGPGNSDDVYLVSGESTVGAKASEYVVGILADSPAVILAEAAQHLTKSGADYAALGLLSIARDESFVANRIAFYTGDIEILAATQHVLNDTIE